MRLQPVDTPGIAATGLPARAASTPDRLA
ncbi:hypothetical protein LUTEI9C_50010 [Luteimonas sp. 9C]|nr:hypothetical protein LUTEI9C_50010 [Luteimonas sp. 9C]